MTHGNRAYSVKYLSWGGRLYTRRHLKLNESERNSYTEGEMRELAKLTWDMGTEARGAGPALLSEADLGERSKRRSKRWLNGRQSRSSIAFMDLVAQASGQ